MKTPRLEKSRQFLLVEKSNHNAVHVFFMCRERAEQFLRDVVPGYCEQGLYMDKTLTPESFEIIER